MTGEIEPWEPGGALAGPGSRVDPVALLVSRWLLAVTGSMPSEHTVRAYRADIREWLTWCAEHGVNPLAPSKTHGDLWSKTYANTPTKRTGRVPQPATVARKVAAVASFYGFCVDEGVVEAVPIRKQARPKVPNESTTRGLSREEARAIATRVQVESARDRALCLVLLHDGLRVGELGALNVGAMVVDGGQRLLVVHGKGNRVRRVAVSGPCAAALDEMLEQRRPVEPDDPLFVRTGGARFTQRAVCRLLVRIARAAGVSEPERLTPHVLRHTCATHLLDAGVSLHVVSGHLGHGSTKTTERYDRARNSVARTAMAAATIAAYLTPEEAAAG